jgi:hypothetical protein
MEKISWTDRVRNEEVLHRVKEESSSLKCETCVMCDIPLTNKCSCVSSVIDMPLTNKCSCVSSVIDMPLTNKCSCVSSVIDMPLTNTPVNHLPSLQTTDNSLSRHKCNGGTLWLTLRMTKPR